MPLASSDRAGDPAKHRRYKLGMERAFVGSAECRADENVGRT